MGICQKIMIYVDLAYIWSKMAKPPNSVIPWLFIGVLLDLMSAMIECKRTIKRGGPSGIPVVSLVIYVLSIISCNQAIPINGTPMWLYKILNILMFTFFHVLCHWFLPVLPLLWMKPRKPDS